MSTKKRIGMGADPLDSIVPAAAQRQPHSAKAASMPPAHGSQKKERYTLSLPADLIERARDAAWETRVPLTVIAERALSAELDRLEKERGSPFPKRGSEQLPAGRRVS